MTLGQELLKILDDSDIVFDDADKARITRMYPGKKKEISVIMDLIRNEYANVEDKDVENDRPAIRKKIEGLIFDLDPSSKRGKRG